MVSTGIWGKESKTDSNIPSVIMTLSKYMSVTCLWTHLYMNTSSYISTHQYPFLRKKYKKHFLKSPSIKQKAQNGNKLPSPSMNYAKCPFKMAVLHLYLPPLLFSCQKGQLWVSAVS